MNDDDLIEKVAEYLYSTLDIELIYSEPYAKELISLVQSNHDGCPKCSHPLDGNYCWKCRAMTGEKVKL